MQDVTDDYNARRRELRFALISRVLSPEEMDEVAHLGLKLFVESLVPYYEIDKIREMNECLLQQFKLRTAAEMAAKS